MKEQSRLMPWEMVSPIENGVILALYCNACQAFLREDFWQTNEYLSTEAVSIKHQKQNGNDHHSRLVPTGKIFKPHKRLEVRGRCI